MATSLGELLTSAFLALRLETHIAVTGFLCGSWGFELIFMLAEQELLPVRHLPNPFLLFYVGLFVSFGWKAGGWRQDFTMLPRMT